MGTFINTRLADTNQSIKVPPSTGMTQLVYILESLAKMTGNPSTRFDKFVQDERRSLPYGTTLIFIVSDPPEYLDGLLIDLRENGYKIIVLQIGDNVGGGEHHHFDWHHIKHPGHLRRISTGKT